LRADETGSCAAILKWKAVNLGDGECKCPAFFTSRGQHNSSPITTTASKKKNN